MVHSDLAGPITPTANDGFVSANVFVDYYSVMTCHYFLKNKSDAIRAMETFIGDVSPIGKIKVLRTEGGGEYMSTFTNVLIKHGIKHQLSSPHTLQQNGTAERSWRTGFDMESCVVLQSGLHKYMWTYAQATSGYTRNRCYVQRTRSTPYEMFTGKRPNLKNMVPFGTKCFVYVKNHKRRLDTRSQKGVFFRI